MILLAAYAVAWLPCARWLYRRWRVTDVLVREASGHRCGADHTDYRYGRCCYRHPQNFRETADGLAAACAMAAAVLWPAALLTIAVRWRPEVSLWANTRNGVALVLLPSRRKARRRVRLDARILAAENEIRGDLGELTS